MNIWLQEMKASRKSLLIWCVGMVFIIVAGMGKYGGMSESGDSINELMAQMPKPIQAIAGTGSLDLSTVTGYFGVLYLYLAIMVAIHAVMLGANIVSKEERDKTAEFLLTKPISRHAILWSMLLAGLTSIIIVNASASVTSFLTLYYYGDTENGSVLMLGLFLLQLLFLVVGFAIGAISKRPKRAQPLALGLLLFSFLLSIVIDLNPSFESLSFMTPFKYVEAKRLLASGFDWIYVLLSVGIIAILMVLSFLKYGKRDIDC